MHLCRYRTYFWKGDFQANALKQFLLDIAPILNNIDSSKITFVGHSLVGI